MIKKKKPISVRLPSHITPVRYNLTLKPDLEMFTFWGKEVIDIVVDKNVKEITLHSKDIDIETASPFAGTREKAGDEANFASKITYDTKAETATLHFKKPIQKGKAKLTLVFTGIISESLRGFYKSKYEINGVTKHIATTQFEATDARRAFPCFDEPAQKAIFIVSLIIPGTHTAISNTLPTEIKEHEAGYKIVSFAPTPKMSTYLLAFIIGEFECVEGVVKTPTTKKLTSKNRLSLSASLRRAHTYDFDKQVSSSSGTQVRVFTTQGKIHQAKFALDVAIRALEFYNKYFDIPYPLPTLDMIAIPDFESGAMENWGAITYRETALLVDDEHSSLSNKQWVALVIAHEIAHQWFGNLVTMHWWTDLWLNEGFASYIEYLAVDHIFPDWKIWDQFLTSDTAVALRLDALANSHPIEVKVNHPSEINEIFDAVSYSKGASVIRMLAEYLGEEKFRDGLRHYLKKHSYKNTQTTDLWKSFEYVSKKSVVKIMANWTGKVGYPLLSLKVKSGKYQVQQERFFSSRISAKNNTEKTLWQVPIKYESNKEIHKELITKKSAPLLGTSIGKINYGESTLARVKYDKETLLRLQGEIKTGKLSTHDRLGIIRDLFALAEGGYISTVDALEFSLVYKNEAEYIVWAEIAGGINRVYNIISEEKFKDEYKKYALYLFTPLAKRMGWEKVKGEHHSHTFLRNLALGNAGAYGDKNVIKHAQKLFKDRTHNPLPADIRSVVYGIIANNGGEKEYTLFQKLYIREKMHEEKNRYGMALTSFKNKKLLSQTLAFAMSKNVRSQDGPSMIGSVWSNNHGRDITWVFIKRNWKEFVKRYGEGGHFLSRLLAPMGVHIKNKDADDIKKFFKKNLAPGAERTIEQGLERIYGNDSWLASDKNKIKQWLKSTDS